MNDPDLVIETFHKSQGDFMIGMTITDDAFPMALDQFDKLLVRLQTTPLKLNFPVLEELPSPGGISVIPELTKGFFEHICFAQALIGLEQQRQGTPAFQIEIGFMRQKRIALSFDESFILGGHPGIFLTSHLIEPVRQVPQDMELVKDDFDLGRVTFQRISKRLPHVHDRQAQGTISLRSHLVVEPVHVFFGTTQLFTHPNRPFLIQVGDYDGVTLTLADRDFINANGSQMLLRQVVRPEVSHVANIHAPDLIPTEPMKISDFFDRHHPAEPPDGSLEPLGEASRFGQPSQGLLLHTSALSAVYPAILEFQVDARAARVQVPHAMNLAIVEATRGLAA